MRCTSKTLIHKYTPRRFASRSTSQILLVRELYVRSVVVTEEATHVNISSFLLLLLLLLGGSGGTSGSDGGTTSGGSSNGGSGANVGEELLNILTLEGLGEERGPVGLDLVAGGLDDLGELVSL